MNQREVTKIAFRAAAGLIECEDFDSLFVTENILDATEEQLERAQAAVVALLLRKGEHIPKKKNPVPGLTSVRGLP